MDSERLKGILNIGLRSSDTPIVLRKVRLINLMGAIGIIASTTFCGLQIFQLIPAVWWEFLITLSMGVMFAMPLILNASRYFYLARLSVIIDVALGMGFMAVGYGEGSGLKYIFFGLVLMPSLLFDSRWARWGLSLLVMLVFFVVYFLQQTVTPFLMPAVPVAPWQDVLIYVVMMTAVFGLLFSVITLFRKDHETYEGLIEERNEQLELATEEIRQQRDGLEELNTELAQKNEEISSQRDMLEQTSRSLLTTNTNLLSSIAYAERIQRGFLPSQAALDHTFAQHFVLLRPRDGVSGDAYYFKDMGAYWVLASIDCTGHGVPGAFMTMLVNALMEQVVEDDREKEPDVILDRLHGRVRRALHTENHLNADGMDMGLVVGCPAEGVLRFAGARHRLVYASGGAGLESVKGTARSIGDATTEALPFEVHTLPYEPGLALYLFSDGFADQFGGPRGKKFMRKRLLGLLDRHRHEPMGDQLGALEEAWAAWTRNGAYEQVDDVLVLGVKLG